MYKFERYLFRKGYEWAKKEYNNDPEKYFKQVAIKKVKKAKKNYGFIGDKQLVDLIYINNYSFLYNMSTSFANGTSKYFNAKENSLTTKLLNKVNRNDSIFVNTSVIKRQFKYFVKLYKNYNMYDIVVFDTHLYSEEEAIDLFKKANEN